MAGNTVGATADYAGPAEIVKGIDYSWGVDGPGGPTRGFDQEAVHVGYDCSSFLQMAWYRATGGTVRVPQTAEGQRAALPTLPLAQIQPGDLLFRGKPAHHVVMYTGDRAVVEAPRTGLQLRVRQDVVQNHAVAGDCVSFGRPPGAT